MTTGGAPAGWYPDPAGTGQTKYWDGVQWLLHVPAASDGNDRRFTIHYGFALLAILSLIFTLGPGILLIATSAGTEDGSFGVALGVGWILWGGLWTLVWCAFAIQHTLRSRRRA